MSRTALVLLATLAADGARAANLPADPVSTSAAVARVGVAGGASVVGAQIRANRRIAPWFGVEGEAGTGIGTRRLTLDDKPFRASLDYQGAAYAVAFVPVGRDTDVLLRASYSVTAVKLQPPSVEDAPPPTARTASRSSWAASVGIQHFWREDLGIRLDYTRVGRRAVGRKGGDLWALGLAGRF